MRDGLKSEEFIVDTVSGTSGEFTNISGTANVTIGDGAIGNSELADDAASGTKVDVSFAPVLDDGNRGLSIQVGSAIASDVPVTVIFETEFLGAPKIQITPAQSGTLANATWISGNATADQFAFFGQSGLAHYWQAVGSGRI